MVQYIRLQNLYCLGTEEKEYVTTQKEGVLYVSDSFYCWISGIYVRTRLPVSDTKRVVVWSIFSYPHLLDYKQG